MKNQKQKVVDVSADAPAIYANHVALSWADGIVRLTFGEDLGGTPKTRAAIVVSAQTAASLTQVLQQALDALMPRPIFTEILAEDAEIIPPTGENDL